MGIKKKKITPSESKISHSQQRDDGTCGGRWKVHNNGLNKEYIDSIITIPRKHFRAMPNVYSTIASDTALHYYKIPKPHS